MSQIYLPRITLLLFYILARRLEERQPVAFQIDANIFALFDEGGVSFHPTSALFTRIIPNGAWALSDAVQGQTGPCAAFNCRRVHVIYTSSPASRNWKGWVKQAFVVEYVMDIWSLEELQTLLTISNLDVQQGEALFRKYGPSPRIIVAILLKPEMEAAYLRDIRAGAFELAVEFSTVFSDIRQFHFDSHLSSTIFILQADTSDSRQPVLRIPTPFLASTLALALFRQTAAQQENLFTTLSCHSSLCSAVAWIFENYAHAYFSNPNRHPLQARLRNDSNPYYIPTPGWTIAGSTALKTIQPPFNFYWRPRDFNFKGINAVIGIGNNVWVLQFTMSPPQSCAISGLDALFETMNGNADVQWRLAIVGPDLSQAEYARNCQNLTGQWRKTPVYACELPLGELTEKDQQRLQEISDEQVNLRYLRPKFNTMGAYNDTACAHDKPCAIPTAPTCSLPPLGRLAIHSTEHIRLSLYNLRNLYFHHTLPDSSAVAGLTLPKRTIQHLIHDTSVPDSGYASAEDEDDREFNATDSDTDTEIELLRADPLERAFAIKWVTGFVARSDVWVSCNIDTECEERANLLEEAVKLLSVFIGNEEEEDVALTRTFTFPCSLGDTNEIYVELNDAPLSKDDHTSVGLQSWGSAILFAERICANPGAFSFPPPLRTASKPIRILELGAGTGMLSIVAAKILHSSTSSTKIIATDYHPDVLTNLSKNVGTNFPSFTPVDFKALDWEHPTFEAPFDEPFDIILAADVIYHSSHAKWIKTCVERLLRRPKAPSANVEEEEDEDEDEGGVFWLMIPVRTTGRHQGMAGTVDALFPDASVVGCMEEHASGDEGMKGQMLAILRREDVSRQSSIGRADEDAYKLFKIGWIN
ncbi:hypothetical protein NLJ89_g2319 [Agrocybe chaxingu]|uniref:Uncharacterized protein n=1 Tax=Agrocybe chaxingu TaxID=84603 RepID=A0A9W8MWK7_9AGAR|nr:hypothetical protein NLJ89_g2319 [Agrocybe chaxingu]